MMFILKNLFKSYCGYYSLVKEFKLDEICIEIEFEEEVARYFKIF